MAVDNFPAIFYISNVQDVRTALSVNRIPIRLTDEKWEHITCWHPELQESEEDVLDAVQKPDRVRRGHGGALVAERGLGKQNYLLVIYKETSTRATDS